MFFYVNTGNPIPKSFNTVIKIEDINITNKVILPDKDKKIFSLKKVTKILSKKLKYIRPLFLVSISEILEKIS